VTGATRSRREGEIDHHGFVFLYRSRADDDSGEGEEIEFHPKENQCDEGAEAALLRGRSSRSLTGPAESTKEPSPDGISHLRKAGAAGAAAGLMIC